MLAASCHRHALVARPGACVSTPPLLRLPRHLAARLPSRQRTVVRSSSSDDEAPAPPVVVGSLFELTKDTYWDYLKSDDNKGVVVVVDCFTDWCGPCKMIYPELIKMSAELEPAARIVKFNCNKYNKELGVTLKIKVAPTFLLYQNGEKVGEMTGAKVEKLRTLIKEKVSAAPAATVSMEEVAMASYSQQPE